MILAIASLFVLKVVAFEKVTIFVFVFSWPVLEASLEASLKEDLVVPKDFPVAMELIVPPFALVLVDPVETIDTEVTALPPDEAALVCITIAIPCEPFPMRTRLTPAASILDYVIWIRR